MNRPIYKSFYGQVLFAIACGVVIGHFYPQFAVKLKPLGDAFIKLIKMPIAPFIFCTAVSGIAGMQDIKKLAAIFVAQATNTHLDLMQQLTILGVLLLTSKGASAVTGSGFITLAATLSAIPTIPVAGLALILGIDRFMSKARALTNPIGNDVATVVVSKWEHELDQSRLQRMTSRDVEAEIEAVDIRAG